MRWDSWDQYCDACADALGPESEPEPADDEPVEEPDCDEYEWDQIESE